MSTSTELVVEEEREVMLPIPTNGGEIDIQIATAHRYPRNITRFKQNALTMATQDEETAASCFYALPRGGKNIEGPGVRLAEIVASAWGNLRFGAKIVEETDRFIIAQGFCHDLETNIATNIEVRRRITDKYGKKYPDDMISTTSNAACAIALRNAIFKVIPKTYVDTIYEQAKLVAIGDASTLSSRRTQAIQYFAKMGVTQEQILAKLSKAGLEDIDLKDLEILTGLKTSIKDGEISVDAAFAAPLHQDNPNLSKTQNLTEKLKKNLESKGVPAPAESTKP